MTRHLTTDEILESMIGEAASEQAQHAAGCSQCAAEISRLKETLSTFRGAVDRWAARTPAPRTAFLTEPASPSASRPLRWALAGVVSIALVVIPIYKNASDREREARAIEDALLLEQVQAQLSRDVPVSMEPLMNLISDTTLEDRGGRR